METSTERMESKMESMPVKAESVPYIVHEGTVARMERTNKRLWILCIIMFLALVVTNAGWIVYESQYIDEVSIESNTEGGGDAYGTMITGDWSNVNYGTGKDHKAQN